MDCFQNRCLVHILRETMVKYSKIRPFQVRCQLDLCRHEVHYGCLREDKCFYAHSLVELKVWIMQKESGMFNKLTLLFIVLPLLPFLAPSEISSLGSVHKASRSNLVPLSLHFGEVFYGTYSVDFVISLALEL